MKYKNNLTDCSENCYFKVTQSFDVYVPVANYKSNKFVGSSQLLGVQYKKITLSPGNYVYDLFGGVFVNYEDKFYQAYLSVSDRSPLERLPFSDGIEIWPVEKLEKIQKPNNAFDFVTSLPMIEAPNSYHGNSIDSII